MRYLREMTGVKMLGAAGADQTVWGKEKALGETDWRFESKILLDYQPDAPSAILECGSFR